MLSTYNFYRKNKLIISWVILISFILFIVFNFSTSTTNAQQTTEQITVSCAPNKKVVQRNENVTFIATVKNATEKIKYSWSGVTIKSVDSPRVTTSYASLGEKKATVTIVTGTKRIKAECSVVVSTNVSIQNQTGGQQGGNNPLQNLGDLQQMLGGGNNPLGGLTGGQQGGQQGGNNPIGNILGGQQTNGIANTGTPLQNSSGRTITFGEQTTPQQEARARQEARAAAQKREQEAQKEMEQKMKECETDNSTQDSQLESSENAPDQMQDQMEEANQQQMVPTNPIPIVDPIKNIRENIERLTAKDIGLSDQQTPPFDAVVACKTNAALEKNLKTNQNFIYKGDETEKGPKFIQNFPKYFNKVFYDTSNKILTEYANKQSCTQEENQNIAIAMAGLKTTVLEDDNNESCKIQSNDKYNLNDLDNLLTYASPENNPGLKYLNFYNDYKSLVASNVYINAYETDLALGFKNIKNEDGDIENPAQIYLNTAQNSFNSTVNRLIQFDEATEGQMFEMFMEKTSLQEIST